MKGYGDMLEKATQKAVSKAPKGKKAAPMEETPADDANPDAEHRAAFDEWMDAIRAGDNDAAWSAYQDCRELG